MFSGTINSMSHEGGLLLSFSGSSPALESIIIRASDGIYIGKIDGVLGNSESPIAHVGHIDRKLDLDSLIGEQVTIRPKKPREERYPSRDRDGGGRREFDRGSRDGGRGNFDRGSRDGGRGNFDRGSRDRRNDSNDGDWDCPKCNNSNFARRTECNRCGEPRGAGGGRRDGGRGNFDRGSRDGGRRDGGRGNFDRGSRDRRNDSNDGDWDCPKCNNSNFARRTECNRCGEPRGAGGGRRGGGRGNFDRGSRDGGRRDGGRGNFDRGSRDGGRRDGGRGNFDRGSRDSGKTFAHNDWDCPKCNNSNFSFRRDCNRCGEPRPGGGGGGGGRRDGGRGNFDRGSRDGGRRDGGGGGGRRDGGRGNFDRGSRDGGRRDGGGGGDRRDGGRGNFDRGSRDGGRRDGGGGGDRRDGGRGNFDRGSREGRDSGRGERREFSNRDDSRTKPEENNFRKSRGKRAGHAHNNAPKPIVPRKFNRNSDD